MTELLALTRPVSASIVECELTHIERAPIDLDIARAQHADYERCLEQFGVTLIRLEPAPDLPDAVFVEDTAVVLDEIAVIAHPGASARRAETDAVAGVLARHRSLCWIQAPGTLDGGDVLRSDRTLFVGRSTRTNDHGIEQLRAIVAPFDYDVRPVDVHGCLHIKSAATLVADGTLLINAQWIETAPFRKMQQIQVDPAEPFAANALRLDETLIHAREFVRTRERLERRGIRVHDVDVSELARAEGGVTCCSIVFEP